MCGKRMSQRVGTDVVNAGAKADILIHHSPNRTCCDSRSLVVKEQRLLIALGNWRIEQELFANLQVTAQSLPRRISKRNYSLFSPLARNANQLASKIDVTEIHGREFSDANACRIHQFEQRAIR